jgi:hypothetical protein
MPYNREYQPRSYTHRSSGRSSRLGPMIVSTLVGGLGLLLLFNRQEQTSAADILQNQGTEPMAPLVSSDPLNIERQPELAPYFYKFPVGVRWGSDIVRWVKQYKWYPAFNENMAAALMLTESCGNQNAGAQYPWHAKGFFQLMPNVFGKNGENLLDPELNAQIALEHFQNQLDAANGDLAVAAAGYNGGPMALRWWRNDPDMNRDIYVATFSEDKAEQVEDYVAIVTGLYSDAQAGLTESPTAEKYHFTSPTSMCAQAAAVNGLSWPLP